MMKTNTILPALLLFFTTIQLGAQNVSINEDGGLPHPSAMLDIRSETKGLLIPRMMEAQRLAIGSPATGLMVYQTNGDAGFYYFNGAGWSKIGAGAGSSFWGASGDDIFNLNAGKVGIGAANPAAKLEVANDTYGPELQLDGSAGNGTQVHLRTETASATQYRQFVLSAHETLSSHPRFDLAFNDFDTDISAFNAIASFNALSDTALTAYGDVLSSRYFHGRGARFIGEGAAAEVAYITSDMAAYGLHVDLNSNAGSGIAVHATNKSAGIEAISENGNAAYFGAWGTGNALVTGQGKVGIGTESPDGKLTIKNDNPANMDLLVEGASKAALGLRLTGGSATSYNQYNFQAGNDGVRLGMQAYNSAPDGSWATSSYAPIASFGADGYAVNAHGSANVEFELNNKSRTGQANLIPIAYGIVRSNASPAASTGNFSCSWNTTHKRYEIQIEGENYFWLDYITTVTPVTGGSRVASSSVGGKLLVMIYDQNGNQVQGAFQFVTYKP